MYALFLLLVIVTALLALRAGQRRARGYWVAAGALGAGLAYVHPIGPLYAVPAFACGLAIFEGALRAGLRDARPGLVAAAIVAVPYLYALAVLQSRYDVGEAGRLSTTAGRSVAEEALRALSPTGVLGLVVFCLLALAGVVQLARERPRVAALLVLWVLLPIVFFTAVPAETRFFGRYLLPALPAFLILVAAGCRLLGRRPAIVLALVSVVLGLEGLTTTDRLRTLYDLDLRALPKVAPGEVLFSSTGSPRSDRPPELLDDLIDLRAGAIERVEELPAIDPRYEDGLVGKGTGRVHSFLSSSGPRVGTWVFRGTPRRVSAAERRLATDPDVTVVPVGSELLVVRSRGPRERRALVELGVRVRTAWGTSTPADRWPRLLVVIDRTALD
jgi:hypothetical protein